MVGYIKNILWAIGAFVIVSVPHVVLSAPLAQFYRGNTNTPGRFSEPFVAPSGYSGFGGGAPRDFLGVVSLIVYIINLIIPVLIALAVLGLFIGIFRYGFSLGNEDHLKEAKRIMFWGVVGLFVMVSIWGILRVLAQTFLV